MRSPSIQSRAICDPSKTVCASDLDKTKQQSSLHNLQTTCATAISVHRKMYRLLQVLRQALV